jgi:hypothetical protein
MLTPGLGPKGLLHSFKGRKDNALKRFIQQHIEGRVDDALNKKRHVDIALKGRNDNALKGCIQRHVEEEEVRTTTG